MHYMPKTHTLTIRVDDELLAKIDSLCDEERGRAAVMRDALRTYTVSVKPAGGLALDRTKHKQREEVTPRFK